MNGLPKLLQRRQRVRVAPQLLAVVADRALAGRRFTPVDFVNPGMVQRSMALPFSLGREQFPAHPAAIAEQSSRSLLHSISVGPS